MGWTGRAALDGFGKEACVPGDNDRNGPPADAWNARSLVEEPIVRLILDGTVVRVRLDPAISLLVVIGVRADGQKLLLAVKAMGGESTEAWRAVFDDLIQRGLRRPEYLVVDGAPGLEAAIAAVWDGVPVQRCTVHKHRNVLAHAARPSSANGGSSIAPSPTACRKPASGCVRLRRRPPASARYQPVVQSALDRAA
jgi:hypothetical protein